MTAGTLRNRRTVTAEESAERWGNTGLDVLSTPAILGHVEQLCDAAMKPRIAEGQMTVGVAITLHHRAPVRVGRTVEYQVDAPGFARRMEFAFRLLDESGQTVCSGTHERAVIDVDAFKARMADRPVGARPANDVPARMEASG
ncbi:thioesterase family protein [Actinomadura chibensis]|uniref:Fluoroacetyl-CoA-specific thioesterase-like domain-containing protein n=1 Tax=Actinomadura chibensis TaxID=392828 RepID=A0A5D0NQ10_9ACTN|nr:hypothetical protein [Actinomadura chibensis]TYB46399.1 hypothetical protein FXF69_14165 [Actinomadura chibensis]